MAAPPDAATLRRAAILDSAAGVFLRYGFEKTSMEDLARAAGLSRQGLYLHFSTKEALFKEAVLALLDANRAACQAALAQKGVAIEDRLLGAFMAMHAMSVTPSSGSEHLDELLESATRLIGPAFEELEQGIVVDLARAIRAAGVADRWKEAGISANDLALQLYLTSHGVKHRVPAADYRNRMRTAVRIVCRG